MQPDFLSEQVNTASADIKDSLDKKILGGGDKGIGYCKCCKIRLIMVHFPFLGVQHFLGFVETRWYLCQHRIAATGVLRP